MRLRNLLLALMPLLAVAAPTELIYAEEPQAIAEYNVSAHVFDYSDIIESTPTLDEMHGLYPDQIFTENEDGTLHSRDVATNVTIHDRLIHYKLKTATIAMVGYYGFYGKVEFREVLKQCKTNGLTSGECVNEAVGFAIPHIIVGYGAYIGVKKFGLRFWDAAAEQALNLATGGGKRDAPTVDAHLNPRDDYCSTRINDWNSPIKFYDNWQWKFTMKSGCYKPTSTELGYIQNLGGKLGAFQVKNSIAATQFTVYKDSTGYVAGRFESIIGHEHTDICPLEPTGGDGCSCQSC